MPADPVLVLALLARAFAAAGVSYVVGGSFASSLYGVPRATQDVDVVADLRTEHVDTLMRVLGDEFFIDRSVALEAIRQTGSFNVLHQATMFRADVFVSTQDEWSRERLKRFRLESFDTTTGPVAVRFSSPEDTLLHKLVWYRLGNQVSERQWSDAIGMLKIQAGRLDNDYLDRWAAVLRVADLLGRARAEVS